VLNKLDQPLPMGYCNTGTVAEVGPGVAGFAVGDRVASNGRHAEMVAVPKNLCVHVPDQVPDDAAAFTVLGSIAIQGIRLVNPSLGECVVVTGLGLIGLLTVQMLRANGCRVLGLDFDAMRLELAREFGAATVDLSADPDPLAVAGRFSRGRGVDAVIITAATNSSEPMHQAAQMCRKRGRIVLVGVTGLELSRADFYEKELSFQVSCSYGPGRYEPDYEYKGVDYPVGYVRWTEQRNFEAVLDMMASGQLDVSRLISHRYAIADASDAYAVVAGSEPSLGILLEYPSETAARLVRTLAVEEAASRSSVARGQTAFRVGFVGAGNYASTVLMSAFKQAGAVLHTVASRGGTSSVTAARKFGFLEATTDIPSLLANPDIDGVVIATRHDTHAQLVCDALLAGKHVFVEKPLALSESELQAVEQVYNRASSLDPAKLLMVGFNRRFAPQVQRVKKSLADRGEPISVTYTVNAGPIDAGHWTQDSESGGGRVIGECCHFIDLVRFLVGSEITGFSVAVMSAATPDTVTISLKFSDGSIASINYYSNGNKSFPKERIEIFAGQRIARIDNFRRLEVFGWPGLAPGRLWRQDKGQRAAIQSFTDAVGNGGPEPIPFNELAEVSRRTLEIAEALRD
jgi:predicted dehydrogenase/threonine dehydrogenase-like Zn-dependent dehydrogenase